MAIPDMPLATCPQDALPERSPHAPREDKIGDDRRKQQHRGPSVELKSAFGHIPGKLGDDVTAQRKHRDEIKNRGQHDPLG